MHLGRNWSHQTFVSFGLPLIKINKCLSVTYSLDEGIFKHLT